MCEMLGHSTSSFLVVASALEYLSSAWNILLILIGFSVVVFFHELGHFSVAKWAGVRVERFAVGFGPELFGFTRGETRYSFNIFPLGGYVKMLGQEDFEVDKTGELQARDDPRSFSNKPVSHRMAVVSAGVVMNLILAAALFMLVYMIGKVEVQPVVGYVIPGSPAAEAGLQVGDRIRSINQVQIDNYNQVMTAVRLAKPFEPLHFELEREGRLVSKKITPRTSEMNWLQVGFAPATTATIVAVSPELLKQSGAVPRANDVIVEVNGRRVDQPESGLIWDLMLQGRNRPATVIAERADPQNPSAAPERIEFEVKKLIALEPADLQAGSPRDLLGLVPRVRVTQIRKKGAALLAGFLENDVIVHWGTVRHPTPSEIMESIKEFAGKDIPVTVRRDGVVLPDTFLYRARVLHTKTGEVQAVAGFKLNQMEQDLVVLADVVREHLGEPTQAGGTALTKGCRVLQVNGQEITGWADLAERFRTHAGSTVELVYSTPHDDTQRKTALDVPESISTILDLPSYSGPYQQLGFFALDGKSEIYVKDLGRRLPAFYWLAIRDYLSNKVGEEVAVTFRDEAAQIVTRTVTVRADMVNPWYRRVAYSIPDIRTKDLTYLNRKLNPLAAIWAGTKETYYFVAKTYLTLDRLIFTQSVKMEHMSGPVGIIRIGSSIAKADKVQMLYFLALLSANLAVINFLPLPIVDGGLMVFLLIELIKGSPVSLRIQVITQMIGLVLIATLFVLITFQDISNWVG